MSIDFEGMYRQARAEATDVSEHLLHYLDTIKSPLWRIQLLALLSPRMRSVTQERAKHQEEVMRIAVLTALPSAHIDAALTTTQLYASKMMKGDVIQSEGVKWKIEERKKR